MDPSTAPRVLCFGEALVDRLGPPGGDPRQAGAADDRLGGAPANVACGLGRLGTPTAFLGRVGEDCVGAAFAALFADRGVDTACLQWDLERPSRIVLVARDVGGERRFFGFSGDRGQGYADQAIDAAALEQAVAPLFAGARWLLTGTLTLASPLSALAQRHLCQWARAQGLPLAVDVNWRPTFWGLGAEEVPPAAVISQLQPLLAQAALLKCSREEALWLFGSADAAAVRLALPQRPAVLITDGPGPIRWATGGGGGSLPALPVEVVDTTGAGDAFLAGLLHQLVRQPRLLAEATPPHELEAALRFAGACGALVCQGAGAIDPQPGEAQAEALAAAPPAAARR